MPWSDTVVTEFDFEDVDSSVANKVNEIGDSVGRGRLRGRARIDGNTCYHWNAGSSTRVFGFIQADQFHFIGWGPHASRNSGTYRVTLASGSTSRVTLR
jgi:hypothetical protein